MIQYTLTRSNRKTVTLYVYDGVVEVRAPFKTPKRVIDELVASKENRIMDKLAYLHSITQAQSSIEPRKLPPSQYADGEFERVILGLVKTWEKRLGVSAAFVGIRNMTTRWGSCTAKTLRIRLNAALVYCPRECLEYVVVHELAHLRENNHSPRFWAIVLAAFPNYKSVQMKLRELEWLLDE